MSFVCHWDKRDQLTCIGLNTGGDFTSTDSVEVRDVLPKDGLQITFTKTLSVDLASIAPYKHESPVCGTHCEAYEKNITMDELILPRNALHTDDD